MIYLLEFALDVVVELHEWLLVLVLVVVVVEYEHKVEVELVLEEDEPIGE